MKARTGFAVGIVAVAGLVAILQATKVVDVGTWFGGEARAPDAEAPEEAAGVGAGNPRLAAEGKDRKAGRAPQSGEAEVPAESRLPAEAKGSGPERGAASVRGRVVDAHGAPVDGARVRLLRPDSLFHYLQLIPVGRYDELAVDTDARGRFAFRDVLPATGYALLARRAAAGAATSAASAASAAATRAKIDLSPREAYDAGDVALGASGGLGGRVTGPDGGPVAGARVAVTWEVKNDVQVILTDPGTLPWIEAEAKTDADGRWACPALEPGDKTVLVKSPAGASEVRSPVTCTAGQQRADVDVALAGTLWFGGKVLRTDGSPVVGARVFAAAGDRAAGWTVMSGSDGTFRIGPLVDGSYRLGALVVGMPIKLEMQRKAPDETLEFRFPAPGGVTGTITSRSTRKPVRDFRVFARFEGQQGGVERWVSNLIQKTAGAPETSSPDGRFRIGGLRPGPHRIVVEAEGYPHWEAPATVEVVEGREVEAPPLELPDGNAIAGVVVDAAGTPIPKVHVNVVDDGAADEMSPEEVAVNVGEAETETEEATTDDAGLFRTNPLTPRKYRLVFTAKDRVPVVKAGVDVTARALEGLRVVLQNAATLHVKAIGPGGAPAARVDVRLWHESGDGIGRPTDGDGVLVVANARPGRWVVAWGGRAALGAERQDAEDLKKGVPADARFERYRSVPGAQEVVAGPGSAPEVVVRLPHLVTVRGRLRGVVAVENDVWISLTSPSGFGGWAHGRLDGRGGFTAEHVEPGPATVYVSVAGEKGEATWNAFGPYDIRDQDPFDLEVAPQVKR